MVQLESSGLQKPYIADQSVLLLSGKIKKNVGIDKEVFIESIYNLATSNLSVAHSLSLVLSEKPLTEKFLMDSVKNNETKETAVE